MPKVSVILPVYNVEPYIEKCIKSLMSQALTDVEFIFVDDCSPDNSVEIIQKYQRIDKRIKLIRHEKNKYTAEARNTGVKNAKGEYISFVDPDDFIDDNFLSDLYNFAKRDNADIAKGVFRYIPSGREYNTNNLVKSNKYRFNSSLWSAIYKRSLFDNPMVKFYVDTMVGQFLLVHTAKKITTCDTAHYNYVIRTGSCVNTEFSPEKWKKLNVRGAQLILDFMNKLNVHETVYDTVLRKTILKLYQFGFDKMSKDNQQKYKKELNLYLDELVQKTKYKTKRFLIDYKAVRKKYA